MARFKSNNNRRHMIEAARIEDQDEMICSYLNEDRNNRVGLKELIKEMDNVPQLEFEDIFPEHIETVKAIRPNILSIMVAKVKSLFRA